MTAKKTPLFDIHLELGAKMMPFAGYEMPIRYAGDTIEHLGVRQKAGLFDVSHMGEFLLRGAQALPLIQNVICNDASTLAVGKAQYACFTNPQGGVIDDLIVYRLGLDLYMMVVNASNVAKDWAWLTEQNQAFGAEIENISEQTALLALSGPAATDIMATLADETIIRGLPYYGVAQVSVAGLEKTLVATTGYTGERTFEVFCRNEQAITLWQSIMKAGTSYGLIPAGLGARDTLRLEMGYMLYGNDLNDSTTPLEAGLGWVTKLNKGKFVGSDVLADQKANGTSRKLVAFVTHDKGAIPRGHYPLTSPEGQVIGEVTSGTFSPSLKKGIGMGYVQTAFATLGTTIAVVIRDKPVTASVVKPPFIDNTSLKGWAK